MQNPKRYTVTAALPYTNGPIHIGHLAGVYVPGDIYTRYLRQINQEVIYICGSDEHGVAISMKAKKEGITPQQVIDKYHLIIKQSFEDFGISFDHYGRTSSPIHHQTAQDFFKKLYEQGQFIEQTTEQLYDPEANQFLADRFVIGTCPKCGHHEAYGDQCEKCGTSLSATDLINPKSTISGSTPILKETKHWFLPLDQYDSFLRDWIIKGHEKDWKPNVYGQVKSWLDDGLKPRAVTRDLDWGIDVPVEGAKGKKLYVWFDAPIGYISATREWAEKSGKNWEDYWKNKDTKLVHFIGKDNIVFHCITFPAILKATEQYILPANVPANEFMNLEGDKISTSRNWAVWLHEYLNDFPEREDELRYTLIANMPENKDSEFTWQDFQNRVNNELAANVGNFVNRVSVLTHKFYEGEIPNFLNNNYESIFTEIEILKDKISTSINTFRFKEALQFAMQISSIGNKFLGDQEPWKLIKTDESRAKEIMSVSVTICKIISKVLEPLLPKTAGKIKIQFNNFKDKINPSQILFPKIEDEQVAFQIEKLNKSKQVEVNTHSSAYQQKSSAYQQKSSVYQPIKSEITFDDFAKLDIRTGIILEAEKVPKADKLLKLLVDIGIEKRTIISGIAEHFNPEDIIGANVSVLVNLAPRKLKGIESNGMILMAEDEIGKLYFVNADGVGAGNAIK